MKRQGAGRVLHFAVTGALLGGAGIGCANPNKNGSYLNTGMVDEPPPDDEVHANPGPNGDPGADEPAPDHVNEGPVEEPPEPVHVNTVKEPEPGSSTAKVIVNPAKEPAPEVIEPSTNNVRKVEEPKPTTKHVNVAKEPTPKPGAAK
jgi:hypothetical protein